MMQLLVKIGGESAGLDKELDKTEARIKKWGENVSAVGQKLTLGLTAPMAFVGGAAIKLGMDAVESENLFTVSFGKMADAARAWSKDLSASLGLNEYELRKVSGTFYTMFESMGLGTKASYDMATGLTQLAYDMSSFFNLRPEDAFEKIRAGIMGETEPLKQLGILVDENTTKQYAYNEGLVKTGATLSQQEKVLARFGTIMQQTSKAQGDLARTIDSPANQLRMLKTRVEEVGTQLGIALLPMFQAVMTSLLALVPYIEKAVKWFDALSPTAKTAGIVFAALAAAAGPVLYALGQLAAMYAAVGAAAVKIIVPVTGANTAMAASGAAATAGAGGVSRLAMAFSTLGGAIALVAGGFAGWKLGEAITTDSALTRFVNDVGNAVLPESWMQGANARRAQRQRDAMRVGALGGGGRRKGSIRAPKSEDPNDPTVQLRKATESIETALKGYMKELAPDTAAAAKEAEKLRKEWEKFTDAAAGKDKIADAQKWLKLISSGGKLTKEAQKEAADAMLDAIRAMEETGRTGELTYKNLVATYRDVAREVGEITAKDLKLDPTKFTTDWRPEVLKKAIVDPMKGVVDGIGSMWDQIPKVVDPATAYMQRKMEAIRAYWRDMMTGIKDAAVTGFAGAAAGLTTFEDAFRGIFDEIKRYAAGIFESLFQSVADGFANLLGGGKGGFSQLKDLLSTLNGGKALGSFSWQGAASGALVGGTVGYGVGSRYGKIGGAAAGAASGMAMGSIAGPWGMAIGAGVGALAGWWGGRKKEKEQRARMEEDRAALLAQFGGMERLRETAQKLGIDIDKAFSTKKPEEFGRIIGDLQTKLDAQERRWQGIETAVEGVNARAAAFAQSLERASGLTGDKAEIGGNADLARQFNTIATFATGAVAAAIKETGDAVAAYQSVMPAIETLKKAQEEYGFEVSETAAKLMDTGGIISANQDVFNAVSANLQVWRGLSEAGAATRDIAIAFGKDTAAQFEELTARGVDANTAMALMAPTIQQLWEYEQKFGKITDDTTRSLIDQAEQQGLVGAQMQSVNQKILDVLVAIADAFGAKLPAGIRAAESASGRLTGKLSGDLQDIRDRAWLTAEEIGAAFNDIELPTLRVPVEYDVPSGLPDNRYTAGNQTINVNVDGYQVASATAPYLPGVLDLNGV